MKKNTVFLMIVLIVLSCSSSVEQRISEPNLRLRNYNNIVLNLVNLSGGVSLSTATLGEINSAQIMSGNSQGRMALESLQFELMGIGFNFVSDVNQAAVIVEFTIGTIRFDPIAGWIADQAFVKFIDKSSGKVLAFYSAKAQFITPTVTNIIKEISNSIKQNY